MKPGLPYHAALERCRQRMLRWALRKKRGNVQAAAAMLGLDRVAMHVMMKRHGIDPWAYRFLPRSE